MPTSISSAAAYVTAAEFMDFYDSRIVGQLVADDKVPVDEASLLTNTRLARILKAASGDVEAAAFMGGKYTAEDLNALTVNGAEMLKALVSDIAILKLKKRRAHSIHPGDTGIAEAVQDALDRLRQGEAIFPLQAHADAGLPERVHYGYTTLKDKQNLASFVDERWFGLRNNMSVGDNIG